MALVAYSDSEDSDTEVAPAAAPKAAHSKSAEKSAFQKIEPRKIKVDLPSIKSGNDELLDEEQPPAKKAKTAGAFSGFNSLLPAPKRAAATAPKQGVSLKTSSEAAFSRESTRDAATVYENETGPTGVNTAEVTAEPKIVGKATKFKPLSVANKKKPIKKTKAVEGSRPAANDRAATQMLPEETAPAKPVKDPVPQKPKKSLFSVPQDDGESTLQSNTTGYDPLMDSTPQDEEDLSPHDGATHAHAAAPVPAQSNANSIQSLASDLNLTPAQRRQLFGRNAKDGQINITHFNMDNEYAANEQIRQAGEVVEHRAVKAIAPGKHSLQQLVNNARSQQDNLEDKWADGRRQRGEGSSRYGWGR